METLNLMGGREEKRGGGSEREERTEMRLESVSRKKEEKEREKSLLPLLAAD